VVKLNWDASIHKASGSIGFGCVARDHLRNFLGAKVSHQQILVDSKMAEIISAHHAVIFVKEVGFVSIIFEGMHFKLSKLYRRLLLIYIVLGTLLRAYIMIWNHSSLFSLRQMRWPTLLQKQLFLNV
jgi:hypothetical protein